MRNLLKQNNETAFAIVHVTLTVKQDRTEQVPHTQAVEYVGPTDVQIILFFKNLL